MRDAVLFFTEALRDMPKNFTTKPVDCFNPDDTWQFGPKIVDKMKSVNLKYGTMHSVFLQVGEI